MTEFTTSKEGRKRTKRRGPEGYEEWKVKLRGCNNLQDFDTKRGRQGAARNKFIGLNRRLKARAKKGRSRAG